MGNVSESHLSFRLQQHWQFSRNSSIPPRVLNQGAAGPSSLQLQCRPAFPRHFVDGQRWSPSSQVRHRQQRRASCRRSKSRTITAASTFQKRKMAHYEKMLCMPILTEGVFRFDASENGRERAHPSVSFVDGTLRDTRLEPQTGVQQHEPPYAPQCSVENDVQTVVLKMPKGTSFYGTGEVGGRLERSGTRIVGWNTDAWGYIASTPSLYQSHPWVLAVLPDGSALGVLADSTSKFEVDLREELTIIFSAPAFYPVITFGPFESPEATLCTLPKAIGTVYMPAKWTLGYHQCRFSYESEDRVREVASKIREKKVPCDVMWMDIDYMDGYRCFTFNPESFSDPPRLSKFLHDEGFKGVWMLDPGIKHEKGYFVHDSGSSEEIWLLQDDGKPYVGAVWPGKVVYPDYTRVKTRQWWAELVKSFVSNGVDGIWNDMNEPADFSVTLCPRPYQKPLCILEMRNSGATRTTCTITTNVYRLAPDISSKPTSPLKLLLGNVAMEQFPTINSVFIPQCQSIYGMLMARSTHDGMLLANPQKRPFVLTRAGFIGSQRYAATWTGDNLSTWSHLEMSIPMSLNLSLSGQPFSGPDIGGFGGECTPKLYARWFGIGSMLPFSRGHSEKGTRDHEPWSFGKECEEVVRLALHRRYRFLPHLYSLFYFAHMKGVPVMTPLFFADPTDTSLRKVDDAFLLGPLLVSASTSPQSIADPRRSVLPKGIWQRFDFNDAHQDLPLLYLKGGAIIPTGKVLQHTGEIDRVDPLTLLVALDESGYAEGTLYEDAGDGFEYQKDEFLLTTYNARALPNSPNSGGSKVVISVHKAEGLWKRPKRSLFVRLLLGDRVEVTGEGRDGENMTVELPESSEIEKRRAAIRDDDSSTLDELKDIIDEEGRKTGITQEVVEIKAGHWSLKVVPWVGGRIINMVHTPTGADWLLGSVEKGAYEEYSGKEYRSSGCIEDYDIMDKRFTESGHCNGITLEGDVGGGLVMVRKIDVLKDSPKIVKISSSIEARSVGAGSGGFSRLTCLRVHPTLKVENPKKVLVSFTAIDGSKQEISFTEPGEQYFQGADRPNGEWTFVDTESKRALLNRFSPNEVDTCMIHWDYTACNLELWSAERPVSKDSPIQISHEYEVKS